MMFRNRIISALALVLTVVFCLAASAGVSMAAAPEWSGGFPRLNQNDALLQWQSVKGVTEYKVYKSEQKDKGLKLLATVKVNHYIDKGVGAGKTVYYYIAPVVGGKEGERSAGGVIATVKEKVFVPLKTPKLAGGHVKELPGGKYSLGVRWEGTGGTDFVGVNVYRSTKKGKDYAMVGSAAGDSFEDNDVQQGATYYYVVTAVDSQFKETKYSNEISVQMPALPVAAKGETPQAVDKTPPTKMRRAKFLFSMPEDKSGREPIPANAAGVVADEATGHIYVTSAVYGGILVYNMEGKFQFSIRKDGVNGKVKFDIVKGITIGENGNIYLASVDSPVVYVFDFTGKQVDSFTVDISYIGKGMKARIQDIELDKEGRIYITDTAVNRVHVLDRNRKHLFDIVSSEKEQDKKFNGPTFLTLARNGDVVFVDVGLSRLQVFSAEGKHKRVISKPGMNAGDLYYPMGVTTGKDGEIFAASGRSPNIQAFSIDGNFLYALCNEKGDGPLNVAEIKGIYIDSKNRLYVAEGLVDRVSVFQLLEGTIDIVPTK